MTTPDRRDSDAVLRYLAAWHSLLDWAPVGAVPLRQSIAGLKLSGRHDVDGIKVALFSAGQGQAYPSCARNRDH